MAGRSIAEGRLAAAEDTAARAGSPVYRPSVTSGTGGRTLRAAATAVKRVRTPKAKTHLAASADSFGGNAGHSSV